MGQTKKLLIHYMRENHIENGYSFNAKGNPMNNEFIRDVIKATNS